MEKYDTLQTVGEGTYGVVYKARVRSPAEVFFGEKPPEYVAIKKFRRPVGKEESVERTAARETRLLSELKHPNIIEMLEVVRTDKGNLYLIFEFAPQTLLDLIERCSASDPTTPQPVYDGHPKGRGIGLAMTMTIGRQLVAGLGYIHSKGVIHRDVKPENILLTGERLDVVKLCDFGFARYLKEADTSPSKEGAPHAAAANLTEYVSTRWYRAPELLLGPGGKRGKGKNGNYEQSIDVWALGCVVAECDTGEPAFTGDSDVATLKLINDALPVPLPATRRRAVLSAQGQRTPQFIKDRYSPRLHAFLRGCLQYSPSERLACVDLAPLLVGLPDSAVALDSGHSRTLSQSHQRASKRERSGILSCEDGGFGQPSGPSKRRRSACLVIGRLPTTPLGSEPSTSASGLSSSSPRPTPKLTRRKSVCDSRERRRLAVLTSVPPLPTTHHHPVDA